MRKIVYLIPLAVFMVLAGYFAIGLRPDHDPHALPSAMIDKPMPAFDLASLNDGPRVDTASFKGQVVVINFFASWCVPCRIEHPLLMRLAQQERLPLIGIAYKDRTIDSRRILSQLGDPYRSIGVDADGHTGLDFGVYGVPETYVIDKTGRIRKRFVGPLDAESVNKELLPLLKELNRS